ncbi:molybdopterin-dependent oxidoreductase [Thermococcus peptonophilus]|uniref:molybdopterin-dependent oxidoreductase n=1 Tax=Thermococcus peptonophilus TaxID=53952 RepID=UPI000A432214
MKRVVCPYCGFGCNLLIDPATLKVKPYKGEPNRGGKLCPKGLHATEIVKSGERLKRPPLKRVGSSMVPISWGGVAIGEIANRLLEIRELYGPDAVAFLASSKVSNEENYLLQKIARLFGTNNIDNCARLCHEGSVHALKLAVGTGTQTNPYEDIPKFKSVLIWGGYNPAETHPVVMDYIVRAKRNGAKIIAVDVRETRTMAFADYKLVIRPGTDIVLANALAHIIIEEELYNGGLHPEQDSWLLRGEDGCQKVHARIRREGNRSSCRNNQGSCRGGVRPRWKWGGGYVGGMGLTQHVSGVENILAVINLALLLGYIGERGGGLYPMRGQNNVQGAAYMGALSEFLPGYVPSPTRSSGGELQGSGGALATSRRRGGVIPYRAVGSDRKGGDITALYIVGENPAVSEADFMMVRNALKKLDLLVVQDIFPPRRRLAMPTTSCRLRHFARRAGAT